MLLDHPPAWLCSPSPGHPERVEGGGWTPGRRPCRRGRVSEARGRRPPWPHGGRLRVGAVLRGLGTRRAHQRREPPSKHEFGCSDTPSHQIPSWRRPEGPGAWPGQVLTRCWGAPRGQQSHTLIAQRGGGLDGCTCEHARACIRAHTCTQCLAAASTGTPACTRPAHVAAEPWQWGGRAASSAEHGHAVGGEDHARGGLVGARQVVQALAVLVLLGLDHLLVLF